MTDTGSAHSLLLLPSSAKLDYLRSYVSSAAQAVLAKGNSVPGLPGFQLGERRSEYDGHSIWQLHDGTKRVSVGARMRACVYAAVFAAR